MFNVTRHFTALIVFETVSAQSKKSTRVELILCATLCILSVSVLSLSAVAAVSAVHEYESLIVIQYAIVCFTTI